MIDENFDTLPFSVPYAYRKDGRIHDVWSETDDALLRQLWPEKITTKDIGRRMSPPRTKNSVIGRARRLFLPHRRSVLGPSIFSELTGAPRRHPRKRRNAISFLFSRKVDISLPRVAILQEPQGWWPIRVPLLDTDCDHCRAIVESPDICCGHSIVRDQPYMFCHHHLRIFTQKRRR